MSQPEKVVVQGGIRPWMFFTGLAVLSLVILFSTGKLQQMRPLSQSEKSELILARSTAAANDPSLAWAGADPQKRRDAEEAIRRIENREPR